MAVYKGILADRIREWSIGYRIVREHVRADGVHVLDEVGLLEIRAVMAGANRNTRTLAVKADDRGEIEECRRKIDELAGNALRRKSDAELRAQVSQLYDEYVLKEKLEKAQGGPHHLRGPRASAGARGEAAGHPADGGPAVSATLPQDKLANGCRRPARLVGTGWMLSFAEDHLRSLNPDARLKGFGQELNDETYAVCRPDMRLKGQDASHIVAGNSFSEDGHKGSRFDYLLANPPFGVESKNVEDEVKTTPLLRGSGVASARGYRASATGRSCSCST